MMPGFRGADKSALPAVGSVSLSSHRTVLQVAFGGPNMNQRNRTAQMLIVLAGALLIAGAIMFLGRYFGLHVREVGGSTVAHAGVSETQSI